jgi:hypothetical protein
VRLQLRKALTGRQGKAQWKEIKEMGEIRMQKPQELWTFGRFYVVKEMCEEEAEEAITQGK